MAHLVKPASFRVGKTYLWQYNTLLSANKELAGSLTLNKGLDKISAKILKRKRLYLVRGVISKYRHGVVLYNLLFVPKIKMRPREHRVGAFIKRSIYRPINWDSQRLPVKEYVHRRIEKIAKLPRRRRPQVNRWLTKRMFRGAKPLIWKKKLKALPGGSTKVALDLLTAQLSGNLIGNTAHSVPVLKVVKKLTFRRIYKKYRLKITRYRRWKYDRLKRRRFNNRLFSRALARATNKIVRAKGLNFFSYLASKNLIKFKTHQRHIWNYRYRRFRFRYKNYYDVINSFLSIGMLDHAENFLLSILKVTLPLILKIKRFFKFLDVVIKSMPELEDKFSVFKIAIAGKLAGGTKRTKAHAIGYGILPVQTISLSATNNFLAYTHIYGEFGVKLLMCKAPERIERSSRWR